MSLLSVHIPEISWILKLGRNQRSIDVTTVPAQTLREDLSVSQVAPNFFLKTMRERRVYNQAY